MQPLKIITSQNVEIEYELAGLGYRLLAALIDIALLIGYLTLLSFFEVRIEGWGWLNLIFFLPAMGYSLGLELLMGGQTIGKRLCHIKVVKIDGSQPSLSDYLIRWLFRIVDVWFSSGALAILFMSFTRKAQRLGDLAAGTSLIRLKSRNSLEQTILVEVDEQYKPSFPQAARLSDAEANLLREVLLTADNDPDLVQQLANKIKRRYNIEPNMHPRILLATFLADFNYYTGKAG